LRQIKAQISSQRENKKMETKSMSYRAFLSLLFAWMFTTNCVAQATPPNPGPSDVAGGSQVVFKNLSEYILGNPLEFQTSFVASNPTLGESRGTAHFLIQRPNLLRVEISAHNFNYLLISDGTVLTIYDKNKRKFAQRVAPGSSLEALNLFTGLTAFEAKVIKFFAVVHDVAAGKTDVQLAALGSSQVGGSQCDRFNIVYSTDISPDKWEAWLQRGEVPLPRRTVVSNTDSSNVQTNEWSWKLNPTFSADTFVFTPPKDSEKVDVSDLGLRPPH
jgi:outer membrane lipoprotein-sorting protein